MSLDTSKNIDDFESLLLTLQNTLGIVVPDEQRISLLDRITPLLSIYKCDSLTAFADSLKNSLSEEMRTVVLDVVSQTQLSWALNEELKEVLNNYIFSQLAEDARVWIIGCGQGQFAYAMAMELAEYEHRSDKRKNIQFIATDIHDADVKYAELGVYNKQQLMGLNEKYKKLFMVASNDDNLQIKQKVSQQFSFSKCDLTEDFQSLGQMDLIVCPQMLVYFSNEVRSAIIQQCSGLLKPGGIFLTGNNQVLTSSSENLERVDHATGVFYRQKS